MRRRQIAAKLAVIAVALAAGLTPWGFLQSGALPVYLSVGVVVLALTATAALRAESSLPWLCDPLILLWAFLAQFYVVGPLATVLLAFYTFVPQTPARMSAVLLLFAFLLVTVFLGYQSPAGKILAARLPDFGGGHRLPGSWGVGAIVFVSLAACLYYIVDQGGLRVMFTRGYGSGGGGGAIFQLAFHALLAASLVVGWRLFGAPRRRWSSVIGFASLMAFDGLFFGIVIGSRKWLFYLFFSLLAVWLLRWGVERLPRVRVAAIMVLLLVFFAVWGTVRSRPLAELVGGAGSKFYDVQPREFHMGYFRSVSEPFEVAGIVLDLFPEQEPYRHGRTLLVTILGFIPRAVWPEKPVGIGSELTRYTDGVYFDPGSGHSVAPTILGDFYANLGISGVVIGGLLLGIASRTVAVYATTGMVRGRQVSASRVLLPAVFLAGLAEVRGDAATMLAYYVMAGMPIVLLLIVFRLEHDRDAGDLSEPQGEPA